jgi:hypothetical protein
LFCIEIIYIAIDNFFYRLLIDSIDNDGDGVINIADFKKMLMANIPSAKDKAVDS